MATIVQTNESDANIRVALIIEQGRIKPVWFEEVNKLGRDRIYIKQICSKWSYMEGSAKILNYAVNDGVNTYHLALNTKEFTWKLGITEEYLLPPFNSFSARK
jgi:hypothetical protein